MVHINNVKCSKNPGHERFIPAKELRLNHFPTEHREEWRLAAVRAMVDLTVKVSGKAISTARPGQYPGSSDPYPFHDPQGGTRTRCGSGFVYYVVKCGEGGVEDRGQVCSCQLCHDNLNPRRTWWKLCVRTALHVTFDDLEARDADVRFFFDEPEDRNVVLKGSGVLHTDFEADLCEILVIMHDILLGERLERALLLYRNLRGEYDLEGSDQVVIVSHPHGCSKMVTIGKLVVEAPVEEEGTVATYTADTCPGSAGGMVWAGRYDEVSVEGANFAHHTTYHHSEGMANGNNRSGMGRWWR